MRSALTLAAGSGQILAGLALILVDGIVGVPTLRRLVPPGIMIELAGTARHYRQPRPADVRVLRRGRVRDAGQHGGKQLWDLGRQVVARRLAEPGDDLLSRLLRCWPRPPDPERAAKLTRAQVAAALKRARRRNIKDKTDAILAALRGEHLSQPAALTAAYAAAVRSMIAVITTLNEQVREHFRRHPDAEIYQSQPGLAAILGARMLGEFGDDPAGTPTGKPGRTTAAPAPSPGRPAGKGRRRPVHLQRQAPRCPHGLGVRVAERVPRRPRLL